MLTEPNFLAKKIVVVNTTAQEKLSFKNDNLIVKDKKGKIKLQYTCHRIFIVYIIGGFTLTTGLLERGKRFGISFVFLTRGFKFYESIPYKSRGNTALVKKQYHTTISFEIAKNIVQNKIENQKVALQSIRLPNSELVSLNNSLEKFQSEIKDLQTLMGIEGTAAKFYFNRMFSHLGWAGRKPRVKRDVINLLLDIGYTVLFNYLDALVSSYGFDTYKGNLHQEFIIANH